MSSTGAVVSLSAVSTSFVVGVSVACARNWEQRVLFGCDIQVAFSVVFTVVLPPREVATCDRVVHGNQHELCNWCGCDLG